MDHKDCSHLLNSLSDFIDDDLSEDLCAEITRHLESCENCQVVVNTLRKTVELYHVSAQTIALPDDVRERLYLRLELKDFIKK